MPWFRTGHANARRSRGVMVSLATPASSKSPHLRVRLSLEAVAALGATEATTVEMLWGDGADVRGILLLPAAGGVRLRPASRSRSGTLGASFGRLPLAPIAGVEGERWSLELRQRPVAECPWAARDGGLAVELPGTWWARIGAPQVVAPQAEPADRPAEAARVEEEGPGTEEARPATPVEEPQAAPAAPRSLDGPQLHAEVRLLDAEGLPEPEIRRRTGLSGPGLWQVRQALRATLRGKAKAPVPAAGIDERVRAAIADGCDDRTIRVRLRLSEADLAAAKLRIADDKAAAA